MFNLFFSVNAKRNDSEFSRQNVKGRQPNMQLKVNSNIIRNKQKVLDAFKQTGERASKHTRMQKGQFDIVEKAVY